MKFDRHETLFILYVMKKNELKRKQGIKITQGNNTTKLIGRYIKATYVVVNSIIKILDKK